MEFKDKIIYYQNDMKRKNISIHFSSPLLYRILWKMGIEIKPPLFRSVLYPFFINNIMFSSYFIIAIPTIGRKIMTKGVIIQIIFISSMISLIISCLWYDIKKKSNLSDWKTYPRKDEEL